MRGYALLLVGSLFLLTACTAQPPAQSQGDYRINATLKDIMDSMVDPGSDFIWESVDAKNPEDLLNAGDAIDKACENCHLKYWYPEEAKQFDKETKERQANPRKQ